MHNLTHTLEQLYGPEAAFRLEQNIATHLTQLPQPYTFSKQPNWYKNMNFYITYPDSIPGNFPVPLQNLKEHLDWIRDLGCNAVHVLPFLRSPMIDKGFDISDFYTIRPELGSMEDLQLLNDRAQSLGLHVFMDLVFNHISDQHEWFQKAESGDEYYRDFFFCSKERPEYIRTVNNEYGVFAEYIVDGAPKQVYVVFPDVVGEIPHWRQGKDGYWYYHTFYPQQLDVNWFNPNLFMEFAKIVMHWTSFGFHFRLDAIPFVGKGIYKDAAYDDEKTHTIIQAMYMIARRVNPNCAFLVETYESLPSVIRYFGTTNRPETTVSYNFHQCTSAWLSLVKEDRSFIAQTVETTQAVPIHAEWINFLRNHDELSVAFIDDQLREDIVKTLTPLGAPFRQGHAVAGRTYSLLGKNPERFKMAYTLLASVPGTLGVMYGDEIGMENLALESLSEEEQKDTRNINRGVMPLNEEDTPLRRELREAITEILNKRRFLNYYLNIPPELVDLGRKQMFICKYKYGISELLMLINLGNSNQDFEYIFPDHEVMLKVNTASTDGTMIHLGPYGCLWLQR